MKLTDRERAENREALAGMNLPQRLDHIFEYYKFPLVLALIAAVALGSVLYYRLTRKEALLYVGYANISIGETLDRELGEGFARAIGKTPSKSEVRFYRNLYLSRDATVQNHEYAYASQLKVMAAMANGQLDVLLMNREAYDIMSAGGYTTSSTVWTSAFPIGPRPKRSPTPSSSPRFPCSPARAFPQTCTSASSETAPAPTLYCSISTI